MSCRNNQQKIPKRVYTCLEEVGAASRDELFYVIFNHLPKVVGQQMERHKAAALPLFRKAPCEAVVIPSVPLLTSLRHAGLRPV